MSRTSIKERNRAIRKAWEREQQLVQEGKGTRDWTKEQQKDILDPDKGKAYDDQGRAFEGQHMKSAAEYPEYQGDPDNIQFLTRDEHLEAHKGSWQNPTNWYYDPITKEFIDFADGGLIPCEVILLSEPFSIIATEPTIVEVDKESESSKNVKAISRKMSHTKTSRFRVRIKMFFESVLNTLKEPETIEGIVNVVSPIVAEIAENKISGADGSMSSQDSSSSQTSPQPVDVAESLSDELEKPKRASPIAHTVTGYDQERNGKIVHINPYPRGGKKDK